jgi:hypothetical protein
MARYSEHEELYLVMRYVSAVGGAPLPLFPPGSFEGVNTRVWKLP